MSKRPNQARSKCRVGLPSTVSKGTKQEGQRVRMGSWKDGVRDPDDDLKLRVGAIFVLLLVSCQFDDGNDDRGVAEVLRLLLQTSAIGSLLPIISKRYHNTNGDRSDTFLGSLAPAFFDFTSRSYSCIADIVKDKQHQRDPRHA